MKSKKKKRSRCW